jgi:hypothetical protein
METQDTMVNGGQWVAWVKGRVGERLRNINVTRDHRKRAEVGMWMETLWLMPP